MQLIIISKQNGQPVEGVFAFISPPFKSLPPVDRLAKLPTASRGTSDADGLIDLRAAELTGPAQLSIVAKGSTRRRVVFSQQFENVAAIPDRMEVEVDLPGRSENNDPKPIIEEKPKLPDREDIIDRYPRPKGDGRDPLPGNDGKLNDGARPRPAWKPRPVVIPKLGEFAARTENVTSEVGASLRSGLVETLRKSRETEEMGRDFADKVLRRPPDAMRQGDMLLKTRPDLRNTLGQAQQKGIKTMKSGVKRARGMLLRGTAAKAIQGGKQMRLPELLGALPSAAWSSRISRQTTPARLLRDPATKRQGPPVTSNDDEDQTHTEKSREDILNELALRLSEYGSGQRADYDTVAANLQNSLAAGPADEAAYYDLPVLHVAWKDVWEQAFDDLARKDIIDLYKSVVEVVPREAVPSGDYAEASELNDLLFDLGGVVTSATAAIALPNEIADWLDGLKEVWPLMSLNDQEYLRCLYHVQMFCDENYYREADEFQLEEYKKESKKIDKRDRAYYSFWRSYPTGTMRSSYPTDYTSGDWSYEYGEPVEENDTEEGYLVVAFRRYINLTNTYLTDYHSEFGVYPSGWLPTESLYRIRDDQIAHGIASGFLKQFKTPNPGDEPGSPLGRAEALINKLQRHSDSPYNFDVFAQDSYNFGVITTFRQKWQPLAYQAGDLAGTLPLAPNEKRSFSVTRKHSASNRRTSTGSSSTLRSSDTSETSRAEGEIFRRTATKLAADVSFDSKFKSGFLGNGGELAFGGGGSAEMSNESSQTKRDLREVTRNSAQEYRDERKLEISTETDSSYESVQTREISNPNNELTVTYLFYELQRRFEVSERLHDIVPVILVAFTVPKPHEINETWVLKHAWILRDILLDNALLPVFDTLSQDFVGDEVAVELLEVQWKTQMTVVSDLRLQAKSHVTLREQARDALERAMAEVINLPDEGNKKEVGTKVAQELFGANESTDAARQALDWAETDVAGADAALRDAIGALEKATADYLGAVRTRLNRRHQVDQLILHIKTNILHYMQEIWRREPKGQRYLRIYDIKIAWSDLVEVSKTASSARGGLQSLVPVESIGQTQLGAELARNAAISTVKIEPVSLDGEVELHEVADLSHILGFRGNYAAFRLKEPNAISAYMLQDFLDSHFGLFDPDPDGELPTAQEALEIAEKAWADPQITEAKKQKISQWLVEALEAAHRVSQVIAVPSGELFIEALPGSHPVLEDFKLQHRAVDVDKARIDVRQAEAELQRRIARLSANDLEDPDVDRIVRVEGANPGITLEDGG